MRHNVRMGTVQSVLKHCIAGEKPSRVWVKTVDIGAKAKARENVKDGKAKHLKVRLEMEVDGRQVKIEPSLVVDCSDGEAVAFVRREYWELARRLRQYRGREASGDVKAAGKAPDAV